MGGFLGSLKPTLVFKWFRRDRSNNNRAIDVGDIKGNSNTVTVDQSVRPVIVSHQEQTKSNEIRVKSAQALWEAVQEIKDIDCPAMFHIDITHGSISDTALLANPNYIKAKAALDRDIDRFRGIGQCKEHEPYVPRRLWLLFESFRILSVRPVGILRYEDDSRARRWWEDGIIRKALTGEHIPEELHGFSPATTMETPHKYVLDLIEREISEEIRQITIGE